MGCGSSSNTAITPLSRVQPKRDEDETGSKVGCRGDSAVSKGTTDSGVVMENKDIPELPGAVPGKLPPLTSAGDGEGVAHRATQGGLLRQDVTVQERLKSSEILEELLEQGIIPEGQSRERSSVAAEAYSIMLDETAVVRQRPPARLESLKAKRDQSPTSREDIEEKMRLVEERRKSREDELKTRLRTKSARVRVRAPVSTSAEDEDTSLTAVVTLRSPLTSDLSPTHSQTLRGEADGGECAVRETSRGGGGGGGGGGGEREKQEGPVSCDGDDEEEEEEQEREEEWKQVEELQLLTASGELESDSTFLHAEDKEETF